MVENVKKGDKVFYVRDTYDFLIIKASVEDPTMGDAGIKDYHFIKNVHWDEEYNWDENNTFKKCGGSSGAVAEHCFWTLEEAKQFVFDEQNARKNEYDKYMDSKEKVLLFPLKYPLCGEYGWDSERTNAYKAKVKEYFGVDLEV